MDIVIVLAYGVNDDGTLPEEARLRVSKGVEVFKGGKYAYLLMTGRYSSRAKRQPAKTEAAAGRDFAENHLGVPRGKMLIEGRSRDTIGNAYFSKVLLRSRRLGRIAVVTSDYHVRRAKFIFRKVYGKRQIRFIGVKVGYSRPRMARTRIAESYSLELAKGFFKGVHDSDLKAIRHLIYTEHRAYSRNPRIGSARMKELDRLERLRSMQI